ncbi:686_t:CDS:2 [Dentiscutata erythropus]|uniref:686_t:CDS:1 n=1 Tax=Dentiscutata erythropus TaxID=1348616 RepID=A0A9N9BN68_9GLOM|nr:686_t:CDS:2 [Dentiscutata erythropus]
MELRYGVVKSLRKNELNTGSSAGWEFSVLIEKEASPTKLVFFLSHK